MSNPAAIRQTVTGKMEAALEHLKRDLAGLRTGRASVALFDGVRVDYYGTMTPLKQVANISTPEARLITIQPWEPQLIKEIEKASGRIGPRHHTVERRKDHSRAPSSAHRRTAQRTQQDLQETRRRHESRTSEGFGEMPTKS